MVKTNEIKFFRDDVHGDITINDKIILDLINTTEFQRLRRIMQLGGGQYLFNGANHTRFSHCMGVYYIICKFLENPHFNKYVSDTDQIEVKIAGLLHDIGHGPFSHTFENFSNQNHEKYTVDIIMGKTEINSVLKKHKISPERVASIIDGKHENKILNQMVSSQLDADRLDYLSRDSINTGVKYSGLDLYWIVRNARIVDEKICFTHKTQFAIESYLWGRYHMYKQIYNHKTSIAFDSVLKSWYKRLKDLYNSDYKFKDNEVTDIFKESLEGKVIPIKKYIFLDDYTMVHLIKQTMNEYDEMLSDLSSRVINRKLFTQAKSNNVDELKSLLKKKNLDDRYYLVEDVVKPFVIYNKESLKNDDIYLVVDNKAKKLSEITHVFNVKEENINKKIYFLPKDII